MADKSKIEWTDATWNPIRGCSRVSEGCRNCYAERIAARFSGTGQPYEGIAFPNGGRSVVVKLEALAKGKRSIGWTGEVRFIPELLDQPLRWKRPRKIFVNSMSDLFHEKVETAWIDKTFAVMALAPQHIFQILTKRPQRMISYFGPTRGRDGYIQAATRNTGFNIEREMHIREATNAFIHQIGHDPADPYSFPLPNVWLGVSVEDQKTADERIPLLLQTPAAVRWVSYEPALGPVNFSARLGKSESLGGSHVFRLLDWLVAGGESGPGARPCHPQWIRAARDQCMEAGVPFFFKQWGEWLNSYQLRPAFSDAELDRISFKTVRREPEDNKPNAGLADLYFRVGKKRAGHLLDGVQWQEFPRQQSAGGPAVRP